MKALFTLSLFLLFAACASNTEEKETGNNPDNQEIAKQAEQEKSVVAKETVETKKAAFLNEEELKQLKDKLRGRYDSVLYYAIYKNNYYYYVIKGEYQDIENKEKTFTIGVLNSDFEEIIPVIYDKVYNIGSIKDSAIVVEKDGLRGLYGLSGNKLIEAKYQALYPVNKDNAIAQYKKGNTFGWIDLGGNERKGKTIAPHNELDKSPLETQLIKTWQFSNKTMNLLFDAAYYPPSGNIITPSYIYDLGFLEAKLPPITVTDNSEMDLNDASFKVKETKSFGKGVLAVIIGFFEAGPDSRDYFEDDETKLILMNKDMKTTSTLLLQTNTDDCNPKRDYYNFYGDTLIEIMQGPVRWYPFHSLQSYQYFKLAKNGQVSALNTNRFFTYTKFVKINSDYFYGCYQKNIGSNEEDMTSIEVFTKYLSIEDLDVMRNEIFAEYGYKFKSKKWQDFFGNYKWYKPEYDNVDDFLSETDKYNIKIILETKAKMKGREDDYTQRDTMEVSTAG